MSTEKIIKDVFDEFVSLKDSLQIHLKPDFDVPQTKHFIQTHIPKEVAYKSEILLDTLLNYLIEDARMRIKSADVKLQNAFFDADFRKRVHEWEKQLENKFALEPDIVKYTSDPRLKQALVNGGTSFIVGALTTGAIASKAKFITIVAGETIVGWHSYVVAGAIASGIVTILLSALAFKFAYDKATPKAREFIKKDIDLYLEASQKQVLEWLKRIETAFENEFRNFCASNDFVMEGKPNE